MGFWGEWFFDLFKGVGLIILGIIGIGFLCMLIVSAVTAIPAAIVADKCEKKEEKFKNEKDEESRKEYRRSELNYRILVYLVSFFLFVYLKRSNVVNKALVGIVYAVAVIILAAVYFAPSVVNDIEPIIDVKTQPEQVAENLVSAMYQESNGNKAIECMSDIVFNLQGRGDSERIQESRNAFVTENNNNYKWIGDDKYVIKGVDSTQLVGYERDEYIQNVFNYFYHIDARNLYDIYAGNIGEVALCTVNVLHIGSDGTEDEEKLNMYCWQEYGEWVVVQLD